MTSTRKQIEAILAGDGRSFAALVERYKRLVSHIVFRMIRGRADQEDLCQEVFIKVYENLGSFNHQSKLSTWIARITYNTCLHFVERKRVPLFEDCVSDGKTVDDCEGSAPAPDRWAESRQTSERLCEEIDRLPVHYGLILSLFHLQEMSYAEIGEILGMPDGTVKSYLFRARKLLKKRVVAKRAREGLCA
ncbi:MAG TPA: sigma-70 family RNA polymerase sigma factor [Acidobacteriota bacterium]|nr:sigma-70 family RNA polymerase sigma factor [Acidobacteriota bacterium]